MNEELNQTLLRTACYLRARFFKLWNELSLSEEGAGLELRAKVDVILLSLHDEVLKTPRPKIPLPFRFISLLDEDYPQMFFELPQPPLGIFVWGTWPLEANRMGMVGSRKPTPYARRATREFARLAAEEAWCVVSGGALGIDGDSHEACLQAGGKTISILGSGFLKLHPRTHQDLFRQIIQSGGALISEYPPWTEARPYFFPERNRLIAAHSEQLFLAQAHDQSGSLSTARTALELGREIWVLKPILGDPHFAGSSLLIDEGAHCLLAPEDWVQALRLNSALG